MIKVSSTGMVVSLKMDLRFPIPGQQGHGGRIIHLTNHPELDMSVRSMYTYIDKRLFTARNIDLKRQAKFKPRKCHKTQITDCSVFTDRTYSDFCSLDL